MFPIQTTIFSAFSSIFQVANPSPSEKTLQVREDIEKRLPDFSQYVDPQKARSRSISRRAQKLDRNDGQGFGDKTPSSNGIDDVFLIMKGSDF